MRSKCTTQVIRYFIWKLETNRNRKLEISTALTKAKSREPAYSVHRREREPCTSGPRFLQAYPLCKDIAKDKCLVNFGLRKFPIDLGRTCIRISRLLGQEHFASGCLAHMS